MQFVDWFLGILTAIAAVGLLFATALCLGCCVIALVGRRSPTWFRMARAFAILALSSLAVSVVGCSALYGPVSLENLTRSRDLATAAKNAEPVIAAIRAFENARGTAPRYMRDLVPEFLADTPSTGLSRWPRYEYFSPSRANGERWGLDVCIPKYWLDMDGNRRFQYEPDASKDRALGATLRHGDWVYIPN